MIGALWLHVAMLLAGSGEAPAKPALAPPCLTARVAPLAPPAPPASRPTAPLRLVRARSGMAAAAVRTAHRVCAVASSGVHVAPATMHASVWLPASPAAPSRRVAPTSERGPPPPA